MTDQEVHICKMMMSLWSLKPFLCREAIEEANFGGQFRELHSTLFSAVNFVGFLRSIRAQKNQFVIPLTLLWFNFEAFKRNKKSSPIETKARRRRQSCRIPLTNLLLWFVVLCDYILICIFLLWLLYYLIKFLFFH